MPDRSKYQPALQRSVLRSCASLREMLDRLRRNGAVVGDAAVHDQLSRDASRPPMITATNVLPKAISNAYREATVAVLEKCLLVCPTSAFGESLHNTILHLRLVKDAPFPSRNLGPWMRILTEHPDKQRRSIRTAP